MLLEDPQRKQSKPGSQKPNHIEEFLKSINDGYRRVKYKAFFLGLVIGCVLTLFVEFLLK